MSGKRKHKDSENISVYTLSHRKNILRPPALYYSRPPSGTERTKHDPRSTLAHTSGVNHNSNLYNIYYLTTIFRACPFFILTTCRPRCEASTRLPSTV